MKDGIWPLLRCAVMLLPAWQRVIMWITSLQCRQAGAFQVRSFMEATRDWLADLKLRASWGVNGNDIIDNEAPYTKYLISLKDASYNMNGDGTTLAPGGYKVRSTNPDLKWESTRQLNIGVDAAFLNGRLSASLDYFDKKTK